MEKAIKKLIKEYEVKIDSISDVIEHKRELRKTARHNKDDEMVNFYRIEIETGNAKRQAYVQAKADIDSLLDHLTE